MERFDVEQNDRLAEIVDAVERGDEVVLAREGREVAKVIASPARKGSLDREKLAAVQRVFAPLRDPNETGAEMIRRMRDEAEH